jgi:hypothetical protein
MNSELIRQFDHFWKVFARLVGEFDDHSWIHTGRKAIIPARLSFHILHATQYYAKDKTFTKFASDKPFDIDCEKAGIGDLPSIGDVQQCIEEISQKTERWLKDLDLPSKNNDFKWAGKTNLGTALFLLKHNTYHLGELSSLLNESKNGEVEDHYVAALRE